LGINDPYADPVCALVRRVLAASECQWFDAVGANMLVRCLTAVKYDLERLHTGSPARAKAQLAKLDLIKALKTCRNGNIRLDSLKPELRDCLERLYSSKTYGVILSGYYAAGEFGPYSVEYLLRRLYENRDFPTLLKQAYRFDVYAVLRNEIDEALAWHAACGRSDAEAWRRKFNKLREQELLGVQAQPAIIEIEEELPDKSAEAPKIFELKPLVMTTAARPRSPKSEAVDDPYVVSQTARAKMERANNVHQATLQVLRSHLQSRKRGVSESKLIDAYSVLDDGPAIFEVKSITESNERDQIRHALSQLYEYRFLHSMADASLWIVFSQPPSSQWYIDYLAGDRGIRLVWVVNEGRLRGPSVDLLN
jgi:hypothetical protein